MIDRRPMVEAEALVIGACLLDDKAVFRVMDTLTAEMFGADEYREIYAAILALVADGKPADYVLVAQERPDLMPTIGALMASASGSANVEHYAAHVARFYRDRQLDRVGREIQALAADGQGDKMSAAMQLLLSIAAEGQKGGLVAGKPRMREVVNYIEERFNAGGGLIGHSTGFYDLDSLLSGFRAGCLYIIAGRPGMGKTAVALNCAVPTAEAGHPVLFFSMEMPSRELDLRLVSAIGNIPHSAIEHAKFSDCQWAQFTAATSRLKDMPLLIDDTPAQTLAAIVSKAKREAMRVGQLGMIVVDYIGLMRGEGDNRTQEIGSISRGLKALAKELNCPVLALSQLNRQCEARPDKRPLVSDLRESGDVEQDADVVLMVYRDSVYHPQSIFAQHRIGELLVRKNRHGPMGEVRVIDQLDYSRYANGEKGIYDIKEQAGDDGDKKKGGSGFDLA